MPPTTYACFRFQGAALDGAVALYEPWCVREFSDAPWYNAHCYMEKPDLYNLSTAELTSLLHPWGQPAFRARQIYRQLYVGLNERSADNERPTQSTCANVWPITTQIGSLALLRVQKADTGLTRKALFRLPGGAVVETVLMVYPDRATVCVSTQAGCAMGCVFCATGKLGLLRNLSSGEIVEQALWASRELRRMQSELPENPDLPAPITNQAARISNLVFMGMGEPFANYERWWQAVERLHDPQGFQPRRTQHDGLDRRSAPGHPAPRR
jgi:23S rRNA (adenine2503-C2)-methyltransferase